MFATFGMLVTVNTLTLNPSASPSHPFKTHNLLNSQVCGLILGADKSFNAPLLLNSRGSS